MDISGLYYAWYIMIKSVLCKVYDDSIFILVCKVHNDYVYNMLRAKFWRQLAIKVYLLLECKVYDELMTGPLNLVWSVLLGRVFNTRRVNTRLDLSRPNFRTKY